MNDPFNNWFGRRGTIFISAICESTDHSGCRCSRAVVLIATPIGMAFTHSWQQLLAVRTIFGIGIGLKGSTVPVMSAEVAPTVIRGALVMGWQL